MIALIDYGAGNLTSVRKGLRRGGRRAVHAEAARRSRRALTASSCRASGISRPRRRSTASGARPSATRSNGASSSLASVSACSGSSKAATRTPEVTGLGVIAGRCRRLPPTLKVPHVGWNSLEIRGPSRLLAGVEPGTQAYFTHSYAADITPEAVAVTTHATPFASVVETDRVFGVQFHPEKSGTAGVRMLRNFVHAMLSKRLIACLDVRNGCVVKGVQFEGLRNAGDPAALARRYNVEGIDELVILDVTATLGVASGTGRDDSRRLPRAVHPAGRRRRHPIAGRCRGGDRGGGGQGQRQQCGARRSCAHHPAGRPLRQPGHRRRDRRQAGGRAASTSTREAAAR